MSRTAGNRRQGGPISDDDRLENSIRICQLLMTDLKSVLIYQNEIFIRTWQIQCFSNVYQYYDSQLTTLCKPVVESLTRTLKTYKLSDERVIALAMEASGESSRDRERSPDKEPIAKLTMGTALFELYLCLQQFHK